MLIYTIGMQGIEIEDFLKELSSAHVGMLLDVRKIGCTDNQARFSILALRRHLSGAGISYIHFPKAASPAAPMNCLNNYREYLQANRVILWDLLTIIRRTSECGRTVCLSCKNKTPDDCHRSILVDALLKMEPVLSVIHLPINPAIPRKPPVTIPAIIMLPKNWTGS